MAMVTTSATVMVMVMVHRDHDSKLPGFLSRQQPFQISSHVGRGTSPAKQLVTVIHHFSQGHSDHYSHCHGHSDHFSQPRSWSQCMVAMIASHSSRQRPIRCLFKVARTHLLLKSLQLLMVTVTVAMIAKDSASLWLSALGDCKTHSHSYDHGPFTVTVISWSQSW